VAGRRKDMETTSYLNIKVEDYATQEDDLILEVDEFDAYDFPREDIVPEADYLAIIVEAKTVKKSYQATHYDVYFDMIKYQDWQAWNSGYRDSVPYYHMVQRFKIDSQPEKKFRSYMSSKLGSARFTLKKLTGLTGAFKLVYTSKSELGSIDRYYTLEVEADCFEIPED
jgi:hypothetical protein